MCGCVYRQDWIGARLSVVYRVICSRSGSLSRFFFVVYLSLPHFNAIGVRTVVRLRANVRNSTHTTSFVVSDKFPPSNFSCVQRFARSSLGRQPKKKTTVHPAADGKRTNSSALIYYSNTDGGSPFPFYLSTIFSPLVHKKTIRPVAYLFQPTRPT